jgi:hypothetical protein
LSRLVAGGLRFGGLAFGHLVAALDLTAPAARLGA